MGVSYPDVAQDDKEIFTLYMITIVIKIWKYCGQSRETEDNGFRSKALKVVVDKPH